VTLVTYVLMAAWLYEIELFVFDTWAL